MADQVAVARVLLRTFYLYSISLSYSLLLQRERLTGSPPAIFTEPTKTPRTGRLPKGITMAKTKGPSPIDIHVGSRMRMRRMALGMSQEKLATRLGLTFQQVQKYEKGANRMGSSRLQQAADVLGVAAAFFFEGAGGGPYQPVGSALSPAYIDDFVASEEGLRLASVHVPTPAVRRRIVDLVNEVASESGSSSAP